MRSTTVDWQESQGRESSPMRLIFTRLQKQLSSRSIYEVPFFGSPHWHVEKNAYSSDVAPFLRLLPKPAPEEKYSPVSARKHKL